LSDELAIVRAVQEAPPAPAEVIVEAEQLAGVSELRPVRQARPPDAAAEAELGSEPPPPSVESTAETAVEAVADHPSEGRRPVGQDQRLPDSAQDQRLPDSAQDQPLPDSAQDQPLPDSAQEQRAVAGAAHGGASDASAVPEVAAEQGGGWEPAIVVNYPVEPSQVESGEERGEQLSLLEHPPSRPRHRPPVPAAEEAREAERVRGTDEPGPPDSPVQIEDREDEADALEEEQEPAPETVEKPKPARTRKRASVPSWDEIMFGSPKQRP